MARILTEARIKAVKKFSLVDVAMATTWGANLIPRSHPFKAKGKDTRAMFTAALKAAGYETRGVVANTVENWHPAPHVVSAISFQPTRKSSRRRLLNETSPVF
ncbi:hypothetical protein EMMF5_003418 [Cystobasidiomycetes sp. EMM_F5]